MRIVELEVGCAGRVERIKSCVGTLQDFKSKDHRLERVRICSIRVVRKSGVSMIIAKIRAPHDFRSGICNQQETKPYHGPQDLARASARTRFDTDQKVLRMVTHSGAASCVSCYSFGALYHV
jgi:hypothetical protein